MTIASPRVDELAHRLARLTGETVETALERAIEERLSRLVPKVSRVDRPAALRRFLEHAATLPIQDNRQPDEIIGYGPGGLPS